MNVQAIQRTMEKNVIVTEIVDLTPEMAADLLKKNNENRPISKSTLEKLEKAIRRGEWRLNGETIIIFSNGNIGDGQHRCHAVINTGVTIKTLIIRGVGNETFNTIDQGKSRSSSDVLAIAKEVNTVKLASAVRTYLTYSMTGRDVYCVTPSQIEKCLLDHPEIRYWVQLYCGKKSQVTFLPASFCGYMAIAAERHGRRFMEQFFFQVASGELLTAKDPALVLRNRIMGQTKAKRLPAKMINAFIIKSINAFVMCKELTFLRMSDDEEFPKIV